MMNAEHYRDPTATEAVNHVSPRQPIEYISTPVYVAGANEKKAQIQVNGAKHVSISEMDLGEVKKHLKTCAKSNGDPLVCVDCGGGCPFGARAMEILDTMTKTNSETRKAQGRQNGAQANMRRAMLEYKAAIDSGDPIQYILDHSKLKGDDEARTLHAKQKFCRWKKMYGGLVKPSAKVPKQEPIPVEEFIERKEEPHLMQMPCLSKKVAAERKAAEEAVEFGSSFKQVFINKLNALKAARDDAQQKIDELMDLREKYSSQISAMMTTADCLEIAIDTL